MRRECRERFTRHRLQRKPLVSDPDMLHGTCVTHVPWCMSGSLTRGVGENVPGIPSACVSRIFTYLARGPLSRTPAVLLAHVQVRPITYERSDNVSSAVIRHCRGTSNGKKRQHFSNYLVSVQPQLIPGLMNTPISISFRSMNTPSYD